MISFTTISHLQGIREAAEAGQLQLGVARLAAGGTRVAVVAEVKPIDKGTAAVTPLAMLKPTEAPFLNHDGSLTEEARRVCKLLQGKILSADHETWFREETNGRVQVSFAKRGAPAGQQGALLILPWEDPHELFEHTALDGGRGA
jgi:hypothetical protein